MADCQGVASARDSPGAIGVTPERWAKIKELLWEVMERPPEQRAEIITRLSAGDPELEKEIQSLMRSIEDAGSLLEPPERDDTQPAAETGNAQPILVPEQLLAGRYRIIRLVARGGMAEVYEADDLELHQRVALKTVHPWVADDKVAIERFKREIALARKISHPNVCRIFDLGIESLTSDARPPIRITFLTMEFLRGETLSAKLARDGPMKPALALPIIEQLCEALSAAHSEGIVHRDFKSPNIMLVPNEDEPGKVRAIVTDFGVARADEGLAGEADTLTVPGTFIGTPAYVAPEQIGGGKTTSAADIYSLGVVLFEMVTGKRPFSGQDAISVALNRLKKKPVRPRQMGADVDARWEDVILRCMEPDPADRFADVRDVARALRGEHVAPGGKRRRRRKQLVIGAAIAATLLAALAWRGPAIWRLLHHAPAATAQTRPSVAVLQIKNSTGRPEGEWLSTAVAEMLRSELAAGEKIRVIPGEDVANMTIELSLKDVDRLTIETLSRVRENIRADYLVVGSYSQPAEGASGVFRLSLHLVNAANGRSLTTLSETGSLNDLSGVASRSVIRLRRELGVGALTAADDRTARATLPSNVEAARAYSEGLAELRSFDALTAQKSLERAVELEPSFPLSHARLAQAWTALGYDKKAAAEAKLAFDSSAGLPREDRLLVEARYREIGKQWEEAIRIYSALFTFFPDDIEYGIALCTSLKAAGRHPDALAALGRLRTTGRTEPRVDLVEANIAQSLGDFKREREAAVRAATTGARQGSRLTVANARLLEAWASFNLGDADRALAAADEARVNLLATGNRMGVARSLGTIAGVKWQRGDLAGAREATEEQLHVCREIGCEWGVAAALNNLGDLYYTTGDSATAERLLTESLTAYEEIELRGELPGILNSLGSIILDRGDPAAALKRFEQGLAISRDTKDKDSEALALVGIAGVQYVRAELQSARGTAGQSLRIYQQMGKKDGEANARVILAEIALEQKQLADAESHSRAALQEFESEGAPNEEARAATVLASSLLQQTKGAEARVYAEKAIGLAKNGGDANALLFARLTAARISAAAEDFSAALKTIEQSLSDAPKDGLVPAVLEARLELGEIRLRAGDASSGRGELVKLRQDALTKGFVLLAEKAAKLLSAGPSSH